MPARSASRSSAVQIWSWVSIRGAFGDLAIGLGVQARNYYLNKPVFGAGRKRPAKEIGQRIDQEIDNGPQGAKSCP
jgi:hypothetical protein